MAVDLGYCLFFTGLFQYPFCMAGYDRFSGSAGICDFRRNERLLQPVLWSGTAAYEAGQFLQLFPQQTHAEMDVFQMVPLRFPGIFHDHVRKYGVSDLSGGGRQPLPSGSNQTVLGIQNSLGMDLHSRYRAGLDCTVQLRFLQRDAYITASGTDRDGTVQAQNLVYILPHGNHDPGNL